MRIDNHHTMQDQPRRQMLKLLLCAMLLASTCTGCKAVVLLGYLIGGPPSIEPPFDIQTKTSLKEDDKRIAVVCYAPKELKFDTEDVDDELAQHVAMRLNSHGMKVIAPAAVQNWLDQNDDWDSPAEVGHALEADWVVYIDMQEYSLWEEGSMELYRGRTTAMVKVFDMNDGDGEEIFTKEIVSVYPIRAPKPAHEIKRDRFKALYLSRLSEEIGQLFYEHYAGDEIAHGVVD
ncbi:hypothetical protein Mal52_05110 [Symmachiella dynata]|uniref:Lipoprotein n=1 Tax=Symmachiella dynata TaxID=2527995 RepID=A0A517ZHU8_9PLAN|nr:hypothetical protein [Symmachiella dynata]QDU42056.1 hypothetical protein Mal52_05110 [Symmachiella dynata]